MTARTESLAESLDRRRHKAADRVRNAANPAEREQWESITADLDGAAALVRRADATLTAILTRTAS